jgi:hypothetical protein
MEVDGSRPWLLQMRLNGDHRRSACASSFLNGRLCVPVACIHLSSAGRWWCGDRWSPGPEGVVMEALALPTWQVEWVPHVVW